jgi:N utilization substance protein B
MGERRQSRELALKVLYQMEHSHTSAHEALVVFESNFRTPERLWKYAQGLVTGIGMHLDELDAEVEAVSRRWKMSRMAQVDRNVLRIAAYEMLYTEIPPKVAITEAVELAKRYSSEEAPAFINGVLDSLLAAQKKAASQAE